MRIDHVAVWVKDLEIMKNFYERYFAVSSSKLYQNKKTGFKSYFLKFDNNSRIEIMSRDDIFKEKSENLLGYAHISISLGTKDKVDQYTEIFRADGYKIVSEPRVTGDGYYESVICDPENNLIELTI